MTFFYNHRAEADEYTVFNRSAQYDFTFVDDVWEPEYFEHIENKVGFGSKQPELRARITKGKTMLIYDSNEELIEVNYVDAQLKMAADAEAAGLLEKAKHHFHLAEMAAGW